jgi:hypothetical protein
VPTSYSTITFHGASGVKWFSTAQAATHERQPMHRSWSINLTNLVMVAVSRYAL